MPFTPITYEEMDSFLTERGFQPIDIPRVKEIVYGKVIAKNVCLRVYTTIENGVSREKGSDAIRVSVVRRYAGGIIKPISQAVSRVNRTENWRYNLDIRLDNAMHMYEESLYQYA